MTETWRDIEGFEGTYQVSNIGRIKSLARTYYRSDGARVCLKEKMLKPYQLPSGYMYIDLKKDKKNIKKYIHRLVCQAFLDEIDSKPEVNHINGIKHDNSLNNLEWVNRVENVNHALDYLDTAKCGEKSCKSKLTLEQAKFIKANYKPRDKKNGSRALANKFGVVQSVISRIVNGQRWKRALKNQID